MTSLGRCLRCMSSNHGTTDCRTSDKKVWCFFCKTNGIHPSPLCKQHFSGSRPTPTATSIAADQSPIATTNATTVLNAEERSLLLTAVTTVSNPKTGELTKLRLLLDSGSHRSYITDSCAADLKLDTASSTSLNVAVFGTQRTLSVATTQVEFSVLLRDGSSKLMVANTTPIITSCPIHPGRLPEDTTKFIDSMKYALADTYDTESNQVDILVGSDYLWEFVTGARLMIPGDLYMIPSSLGLLLGGRYLADEVQGQSVMLCLTDVSSPVQIPVNALSACENRVATDYPDIDAFWSLDKIGITDNPNEVDDDKALRQFNDTVTFENGRYQVCWPWKDNKSRLATNYGLAFGRFLSTLKRFKTGDPAMLTQYQKIIDDQQTKGVIEAVNPTDVNSSPYPVHYLPHHPVVKLSSTTTKVRIVYDASSKSRKCDVSLNECLFRGPVLLPDLCCVLIRFRMDKIAIIADIEKAFLQMGLQASERDVTRFLWLKDPSKPPSEDNVVVFRFCRVPFGVISSPFLLGATVQYHLNQDDTPVAIQIRDNIYVDNVQGTVADEHAAKEFYSSAKQIFNKAGMNLQAWSSNCSSLIESIPESDRGKIGDTKVLGMAWNTEDDTMWLQNDWATKGECSTKREVMKATATIFDPLGLYQPCVLEAKCFLRKLWLNELSWDDIMDKSLQAEWATIHGNISPAFDVRIERHITFNNESNLVVFCDASIHAYATAVYIRTPTSHNPSVFESTLVFAKSRLAPRKRSADNVSLPRLELLGLAIGARAATFVRKAVQTPTPMKVHIFTDSTCVLHWLRSPKPLAVFVNNRVKELRNLSDAEFHHVGTKDNPADLATRGVLGSELRDCDLWWKGPSWLKKPVSNWPIIPAVQSISGENLQLIEAEYLKQPIFLTTVAGDGLALQPRIEYPFGMNPEKSSSFLKIIRVTAWSMKFIKKLISRLPTNVQDSLKSASLFTDVSIEHHVTTDDICQAKKMWFITIQHFEFKDVINALHQDKPHHMLKQLNPGIDDDGVLRCFSRFKHADLPVESLQPILLPKRHVITRLIITDTHKKLFHGGVAHTLAQMRREYWVPQGRNAVRKVLTKCSTCRKQKGHPFALPPMPPWPKERLSRSTPFRFTGLDYLGPINVKINGVVQKMWIALFTCLAIRAVHLEWASDCSAQTFIDCLIRFISRRGCPEQIISDNGAQFRATNPVLDAAWRKVLTDDSVSSYISSVGIRWKFITALAPWQGGLYERLVGIVKHCFRTAVGRRLLAWNELSTLIAEVEAIVNSRPLTYVYEDFKSGFVLRPIDFITDLPTGRPTLQPTARPEGGDAAKNLFRHWKYHQKRLDALWEIWYDEYLLSLRERGHTNHRGGRKDIKAEPKQDEVVVVKDADTPRGNWKLGKVVRLIKGGDGVVRSAEILLPNRLTIQRSIHHLYPLEVQSLDDHPTEAGPANNADPQHDNADEEADFEGFEQSDVDEVRRRLGINAENSHELSCLAVRARRIIECNLSEMAATTIYVN